MGTLTKKLHILKAGGTEEICSIYTTPEEVGGSPYLALNVDGQKGYVKLGNAIDARATHLRVKKDNITYAAWANSIVLKHQVYVAHGSSPWFSSEWPNKEHVVHTDESISGQATVTCDGEVTNMNKMFQRCSDLTSIDLSNFDTSNVTGMGFMFQGCTSLTSLNLSNFDTSNVTDMFAIFYSCARLTTLDLSSFDTSNVADMYGMFAECSDLTTIQGIIDMKSCTSFYWMFRNCTKLTGVKIKNPPANFDGAGLNSSQYTIVS